MSFTGVDPEFMERGSIHACMIVCVCVWVVEGGGLVLLILSHFSLISHENEKNCSQ